MYLNTVSYPLIPVVVYHEVVRLGHHTYCDLATSIFHKITYPGLKLKKKTKASFKELSKSVRDYRLHWRMHAKTHPVLSFTENSVNFIIGELEMVWTYFIICLR